MWVLALFAPIGMAFNLGTMLWAVFFPISMYACLRGMGNRFPIPILGAAAGMLVLFNESYSMWGGNLLSTLAGQFTHGYAIDFFLLGAGALGWELRRGRVPLLSPFLFSAVFLSHAYVFLALPVLVLASALFLRGASLTQRLKRSAVALTVGILLAFWFLVPLLANSEWTTAFAAQWSFADTLKETFGRILIPLPILIAASLGCLAFLCGLALRSGMLKRQFVLWLVVLLFFVALYLASKPLGIINARSVPQMLVIAAIVTAMLMGHVVRHLGGRLVALCHVAPLILITLYWVSVNTKNFPHWVKWNYSGWTVKAPYPDLSALYGKLWGDFSMPRVMYEHSPKHGSSGTPRVFEMLPYFANRATLEGVYMQLTVLAPMIFLLQAEISKEPSCPYGEMTGCPGFALDAAIPRLRLLGVQQLILISPEMLSEANLSSDVAWEGRFGDWWLFRLKEQVPLAGVFQAAPRFLSGDFKQEFLKWFNAYDGKQPFLASGVNDGLQRQPTIWSGAADCSPSVRVDFNRITLRTPCPGKAHYLKFAYHPTWRADTGDSLFLVSPGFLGIVPSRGEVELTFGHSAWWKLSALISLATLLLFPAARRRWLARWV